jgi:hypothetical protein
VAAEGGDGGVVKPEGIENAAWTCFLENLAKQAIPSIPCCGEGCWPTGARGCEESLSRSRTLRPDERWSIHLEPPGA